MTRRSKNLWRWLAAMVPAGLLVALISRAADTPVTVLTNAFQVRSLKRQDAARPFPVRLSGVVIGEAEPDERAFVMWDGTAGIYLLSPTNLPFEVRQGDLVEVEGVSDPGGFAPIIIPTVLRKMGTGEMPDPQRVTYDQLVPGRFDGQWVEISGVVRSCELLSGSETKSKMMLATGGERLTVQVNEALESGALVDNEVRLTGICFNTHNISRQLLSPSLLIPHGTPLAVEKPAPPNPYTAPVSSIDSLMRFETMGSYGHRVHVRGVVTHYRLGEFLWIHDGGRGLRVQSEVSDPLHIGDEVDVVGFLSRGGYTPVLEDATFHKLATSTSPAPYVLTNVAAALEHDADLVEVRNAQLTDMREVQDGLVLMVDWHGTPVRTLLRLPNVLHGYADWRMGSLVNVVGICSVIEDQAGPVSGILEPRSFQLLLRSPADITVVRASSWWTLQRVIWLLAVATCLSVAAAAVVMLGARRRLREEMLRRTMAEAEFTAILKERNRIAREIHDTLAQGLGAVSMQLELVKGQIKAIPESLAQHVVTAHEIVRRSLADARNSIWNMRSQVLENGDLGRALGGVLHQLADGTNVEGRMQVIGKARRLPPVLENDLLRIGQEAITNAMKYAGAKQIKVRLEFSEKQVRLSVRDDGCGFDVGHRLPDKGGFGLMGMRERAVQLRSELIVKTAPGEGTEISLSVPLPG